MHHIIDHVDSISGFSFLERNSNTHIVTSRSIRNLADTSNTSISYLKKVVSLIDLPTFKPGTMSKDKLIRFIERIVILSVA